MPTEFHIGIDDTDSKLGGCTTYTASIIFQELISRGFRPLDFPWLVRLNPNIPWKTRGNGALSLHFNLEEGQIEETKRVTITTVEQNTDLAHRATDPAVVFLEGPPPAWLSEFSARALYDVLSVREARLAAETARVDARLLKGSRGLIGALASMGANLAGDHTFEIIAYRTRENIGTRRRVDHDSVRQMDAMFRGVTFNNVDAETGRVLICPHGPDPVLLGVRGEDPVSVTKAFNQIRIDEEIERIMIFRTNQGTDSHFPGQGKIETLRPYQSSVIAGKVSNTSRIIRGGHVIFRVSDETGSIDCAAYQSTGFVRKTAMHLVTGDSVTVSGGLRPRPCGELTLNVEKLEITRLAVTPTFENPHCPDCRLKCESMGRGQGFRCRKCKSRFPRAAGIQRTTQRAVSPGVYLPPLRAQRHLTKPYSRYQMSYPASFDATKRIFDETLESLAPPAIPN